MNINFTRLVLGPLGLILGLLIYTQLHKLPEPWPTLLLSAIFAALGGYILLLARPFVNEEGEQPRDKFLTGLGIILVIFAVLRVFF